MKSVRAFTSNNTLHYEKHDERGNEALATRFTQVTLRSKPDDELFVTSELVETMRNEAVGFHLLGNALYLRKNRHIVKQAELPRSFTQTHSMLTGEPDLETLASVGCDDMGFIYTYLGNGLFYPGNEEQAFG